MRHFLATVLIMAASYGIARHFDLLDELDELRAQLADSIGDRRLADNAGADVEAALA